MGLYLLGFAGALLVSKILSLIIKVKERTFFLMEMPVYRAPRWKNVGVIMIEKAKIFVRDAGKVIMVISLLLWFLSSYGPSARMNNLSAKYHKLQQQPGADKSSLEREYRSEKLQNSYAGLLGRTIEPS